MKPLRQFLQHSVPWIAFAVLAMFTYAYFVQAPYIGFDFLSDGEVIDVYIEAPHESSLQVGDKLQEVGTTQFREFRSNLRQTLFAEDVEPGQIVPIVVAREGAMLRIPWYLPGFNEGEFIARFTSPWWLPYILWILGTITYLFVRPTDTRWWLLVVFNYLTALWLVAGSGPSHYHIWESAIVLRVSIWLSLPIYWHLHWVFPRPLMKLPVIAIATVYLAGIVLAVLQILQYLPSNAYFLGFMLSVSGSLALLITHVIVQPHQRQQIKTLVSIIVLLLLSILLVVAGTMFIGVDPRYITLFLLVLPLVPGVYLYIVYRHQLGQLELRANRLITIYLYILLLGSITFLLGALLIHTFQLPSRMIFVILASAVAAGLGTVVAFPAFTRFIERRILGILLPRETLLQNYATQIATELDKTSLIALLRCQILPSLLVRQSALIQLRPNQKTNVLFATGVEEAALPTWKDMTILKREAGVYRPPDQCHEDHLPYPWVRLVLPLRVADKLIGLWLLGRRDPDDLYSQAEIPILLALASQTAITLKNIEQAENLRMLYREHIDWHEHERMRLARELHDDILNELGTLIMYIEGGRVVPRFYEIFEKLMVRFRQTIRGLRPAMLDYGLHAALTEWCDHLAERVDNNLTISCELLTAKVTYPRNIEEHLFRIVQEATENALRHAQASTIQIAGSFEPGKIHLTVEDDGIGFSSGETLDLKTLLSNHHFGLAGMYERAELIRADIKIASHMSQGTRVVINWTADTP